MTRRLLVLIAFVALWGSVVVCAVPEERQPARGKQPVPDASTATPVFDPSQSAGLFVGVREFPHDPSFREVPYAVDDAVDLAYFFALGTVPASIPPSRVVLALAGEPQKPESAKRLEQLLAAGALAVEALPSDIERWLKEQSKLAGAGGLLVVAYSSHGLRHYGRDYLLTTCSLDREIPQTSQLVSRLVKRVAESDAWRRLVLLDACREQRKTGTRSSPKRDALKLEDALAAEGMAVLSARPGSPLYDDPERQQGVFTDALLEGLRCAADADRDGMVTVAELADFANDRVAEWERRRPGWRPAQGRGGIERRIEGSLNDFVLARCP